MELIDEVYLNVAKELSRLSKDQNTKVGAIIIDTSGREVGSGRNGTVSGFDDSYIPMTREEKELQYLEDGKLITFSANKYPMMIHSEANAIAFARDPEKLVGATIYCTHMPCSKCALNIAQHKIARVVIPSEGYIAKCVDEKDQILTKFIFAQKGIVFQIGDKVVELTKPDNQLPPWEKDNRIGIMPC